MSKNPSVLFERTATPEIFRNEICRVSGAKVGINCIHNIRMVCEHRVATENREKDIHK